MLNKKTKTFAKKQKVVVFMGRLTHQKGPEYFIDLAYKLINKQPNALFIIAGDGDLYEELILRAAGHKLAASVLFSGFVRGKQQEKLLKRADVFVMPSVSEPFGLVAIEAAKAKIPVVISNQTGVGEVLITNPQIDFWDTGKMADEVFKILNDRIYRTKLIKQQLKNLRKISWKKAALKIKNLYRNLVY
jgi:glycosyltransferase involved in cell wall biosynthesis